MKLLKYIWFPLLFCTMGLVGAHGQMIGADRFVLPTGDTARVAEMKTGFVYPTDAVTNAFYRNTFKWEEVGAKPFGITINSGTFLIAESATAILDLPAGTKYLNCSGNGTFSINIGVTDQANDAIIYYYNGATWSKETNTLINLITDNAWLSSSGNNLIFTLTSGDAVANIIIKEYMLASQWILQTTDWRDLGVWIDTQTWND